MATGESDDTMAAITGDANTAVVDSGGTTRCSVEHDVGAEALAWSIDDSTPEVVSNRRPLSLPLRALLISVLVGAVGLATFVAGGHALPALSRHGGSPTVAARPVQPSPASPPTTSAPPAPSTLQPQATKPPVVELPPPPAPLTPDQVYLRALERRGIYNTDGDPRDTIRGGHDICDGFANGYSVDQVRRAVLETSPNATAFVDYLMRAAVNAYCPGYRSLID